jgi:hypothetical protein
LQKELGSAPPASSESAPASQPAGASPNAEQDEATRALEKALGGETKAPDEKK